MSINQYDSILFDLDGTLWNPSEAIILAWEDTVNSAYPGIYVPKMEDLKSVFGMTITQISDYFRPRFGELSDEIVERMLHNEQAYLTKENGARLFEGVEETMSILSRDKKLFIVSNCPKGYIEKFLEFSKLDKYITSFICSGDTNRGKGYNIKVILDKFKLNKPIFVGDTAGDEKASREAGIEFIYADFGFGKAAEPDYVISSFSDIMNI